MSTRGYRTIPSPSLCPWYCISSEKSSPQRSFSELPADVVSHVLPFLDTTDVAACRQVSRRLCHAASCQGVWRARLRSDFQVFHDNNDAPMALYAALATSTRAAARVRRLHHEVRHSLFHVYCGYTVAAPYGNTGCSSFAQAARERTRRKELQSLIREHWVLLPIPMHFLLSRSTGGEWWITRQLQL